MSISIGKEVAKWPEFQALIKRLGVELQLNWREFVIEMQPREPVKVTQSHLALGVQKVEPNITVDHCS